MASYRGRYSGDSAYERNKYREGWRKVAYEEIRRMVSAVKGGFVASVGVILFTLPVQLWFSMRSRSIRYC